METAEEYKDVKTEKKQSLFEVQRGELIGEVATNLEHVLQALNKLNRGLEGIIAIGNELGSVEALWTQFESVMSQMPDDSNKQDGVENANRPD